MLSMQTTGHHFKLVILIAMSLSFFIFILHFFVSKHTDSEMRSWHSIIFLFLKHLLLCVVSHRSALSCVVPLLR